MGFLDDIFASLQKSGDAAVLQEMRDGRITQISGRELLEEVSQARAFLGARGLGSWRALATSYLALHWSASRIRSDIPLACSAFSLRIALESFFDCQTANDPAMMSCFGDPDCLNEKVL